MSHELAHPLQSLIARAKSSLPSNTGTTQSYASRINLGGPVVVLADVSSSMNERAGGKTRIAHLRAALTEIWQPNYRLLAFSDHSYPCESPSALPAASGGTALELAIAAATALAPSLTIVISDGEPNNAAAALSFAEGLPGVIHTLYVGPESNTVALEFMRQLAKLGCGKPIQHNWRQQPTTSALANNIKPLLLTCR